MRYPVHRQVYVIILLDLLQSVVFLGTNRVPDPFGHIVNVVYILPSHSFYREGTECDWYSVSGCKIVLIVSRRRMVGSKVMEGS